MHIYVCVCEDGLAFVCICRGQRLALQLSSNVLIPILLHWLAGKAPRILLFTFPSSDTTERHYSTWIFVFSMGTWNLDSSRHAQATSTLFTEPSPQPWKHFLCVYVIYIYIYNLYTAILFLMDGVFVKPNGQTHFDKSNMLLFYSHNLTSQFGLSTWDFSKGAKKSNWHQDGKYLKYLFFIELSSKKLGCSKARETLS